MIYLIGGAPRVGKTTLAELVLQRRGIPFIPADAVRDALDRTYPHLGVHAGAWEDVPERILPYLQELVQTVGWHVPRYVIEGDSFFPEHVRHLEAKSEVRAVFLGMSEITVESIIAHEGHNDWVGRMPDAERQGMAQWISSVSSLFQEKAAAAGLPYFDLSRDRDRKLEEAYSALLGSEE